MWSPYQKKVTCNPYFSTITYYRKPCPFASRDFSSSSIDSTDSTLLESRSDSISRTKSIIRQYAFNNHWDYFVTLTFSPLFVNRESLSNIKKLIYCYSRYLHNHGCNYIFIPEYHSDRKSIHLHGLISGSLVVLSSGHYSIKGHNLIYNIPSWKYGFGSAIVINQQSLDYIRISNYILKYVTKDLIVQFGKRRYFASNGLKKDTLLSISNYYGNPYNSLDFSFRSCFVVKIITNY